MPDTEKEKYAELLDINDQLNKQYNFSSNNIPDGIMRLSGACITAIKGYNNGSRGATDAEEFLETYTEKRNPDAHKWLMDYKNDGSSEPKPEPVHVPKKKRGRPKKDTTREEIKQLMHEISSTKYPKNIDIGPEPKLPNRTLTKHYDTPKAMSKSMSSHNVDTVKKSLKAKAGQLLDSVEHSSLLKYINQF